MKVVLNCVVTNHMINCPVSEIASLIKDEHDGVEFVGTLCDMHCYKNLRLGLCRKQMFEESVGVFGYVGRNGIEIGERSCIVLLLALRKCGRVNSCWRFFDRMVIQSSYPFSSNKMEMADIVVMQNKGIDVNLVFHTLMEGYCKKGMMDESLKLWDVMEKKGFQLVFTYSTTASALCNLNRNEEAKGLMFAVEERGVAPNVVCFTILVDIFCK
ncbi:hypothetical protein ACFXTO_009709 [Malus domestica]